MAHFHLYLELKVQYMTSKIKIVGQILALREDHFDNFWAQKTRFLGFLKVVLELFTSCLGNIFGFKKLTFMCNFSLIGA